MPEQDPDKRVSIDMLVGFEDAEPTSVVVRYTLTDGTSILKSDAEIELQAGRRADASGTTMVTGERELVFDCDTPDDAAALVARLERSLPKGFTVVAPAVDL